VADLRDSLVVQQPLAPVLSACWRGASPGRGLAARSWRANITPARHHRWRRDRALLLPSTTFPEPVLARPSARREKFLSRLSSTKPSCYAEGVGELAAEVSQPDDVGEYTVIDWQRVHEEAYRWEVVAALMRDHGDALMQFCVTRLGEGLAEEVTQEVFVDAWQQLPRYRPEASLRAWLFGIARHKCQQAYRNRGRRRAIDQASLDAIREQAHVAGPMAQEDAITQAAVRARLHDSLATLASEDRILLTLWYWKELPVVEIADILGKSVAAVRKRLTRAQQRLKERMHETLDTP